MTDEPEAVKQRVCTVDLTDAPLTFAAIQALEAKCAALLAENQQLRIKRDKLGELVFEATALAKRHGIERLADFDRILEETLRPIIAERDALRAALKEACELACIGFDDLPGAHMDRIADLRKLAEGKS